MNLPDPPASSRPDLVADWVELAAAASDDGLMTGEKLVDAREEVVGRAGKQPTPFRRDSWHDEAEGVWAVLRGRAGFYEAGYPFSVSLDSLAIETLALDDARIAYAFLLAAANLAAFDAEDRDLLTTGFERASQHAFAGLLPPSATVNVFGTSSRGDDRYHQTRLIDRLEQLAADLVTQLTLEAKNEAENAPPRISGDGGLDLVGWPAVVGPRKRLPVYFGQCACGDDWHRKPFEVIAENWDHRLEPVSPIVPVTLIPYAYRSEENGWLDLFSIIPTVLIDRPRWLDLVTSSGRLADVVTEIPRDWMLGELPGLLVA